MLGGGGGVLYMYSCTYLYVVYLTWGNMYLKYSVFNLIGNPGGICHRSGYIASVSISFVYPW